MKFGQSLLQRSVAQWRSYNIDYDSIKRLIKDNTTPGAGKAVSIPGQGDTVGKEFGQLLFTVLRKECDRVSLFVKSKCYEINSRLSVIERQLAQLKGKRYDNNNQRRGTLQTRRKLSRIESDILAVGEEIENLSRFIAINRLAIRKLLKKFRKWTGQTALGERVEEQIINQPSSFARIDLKPALDQYSTYLDDVRSIVYNEKDSARPGVNSSVTGSPESISPIFSYEAATSPADFDIKIASTSTNPSITTAAYWIHTDNVVQLKILLLQYMRYAKFTTVQDTVSEHSAAQQEERMGILILDDPDRLRTRAFDMSVEQKDKAKLPTKFAVTARWSGDDDAMVSVNESEDIRRENTVVPVQQDHLSSFFSKSSNVQQIEKHSVPQDGDKVIQTWLSQHQKVTPLALIWQQRSRLVGLDNTALSTHGIRGALDEDTRIASMSGDKLRYRDFSDESTHRNVVNFAHAVLTLKIEGDDKGLLRVLDHSHLTERVPGFTIEAHAVSTCCSHLGLPTPSWYPYLQKDIRHIPSPTSTRGPSRRTSSHNISSTSQTPRRASRSATSHTLTAPTSPNAMPSQPNFDVVNARVAFDNNIPATGRRPNKKQMHKQPEQPQQQVYWNEYDHGSEFGDGNGDGFVIYVDPDEPVFPTLNRWKDNLTSLFSSSKKKSRKTDKHAKPNIYNPDLERQPLTSSSPQDSLDALALTITSESSSDDETTTDSQPGGRPKRRKSKHTILAFHRSYGTSSSRGTRASSAVARKPTAAPPVPAPHVSTICLTASLIVLAIVSVLAATGRRKLRGEVDLAVLVGVAAAVGFAVLGVGSLIRAVTVPGWEGEAGRERVGWARKVGVGVVFAGVCAWGGGLVAWVVV